MYRSGEIYDEIAKNVIQIYLDYGLKTFPVDEKEVCRKMGVALIGYSSILMKIVSRFLGKKCF